MRIAAYTSLILFRIASSYTSLVVVCAIVSRFEHGDIRGGRDFLASTVSILFWLIGVFPISKFMLRSERFLLMAKLIVALGLTIHLFRFLSPLRYDQLVLGDYKGDVSYGDRWAPEIVLFMVLGCAPALSVWFERLHRQSNRKAP